MSNFTFLQTEWDFLHQDAVKVENFAHGDARSACFYARRTLELAVAWMYQSDPGLKMPYKDNLAALLHEATFQQTIGPALFQKVLLIKDLGNNAVHGNRHVRPADGVNATRELFHFCYWLARTYGRSERPAPTQAFAPAHLPPAQAGQQHAPTRAQLQKLETELRQRSEEIATLRNNNSTIDQELQQLRTTIAATLKARKTEVDTHDYNEAQTRDLVIDLMLRDAGWDLDPATNHEVEIATMPNNQGKGYADYVLWGDDGKPLAVIEAKRSRTSPQAGQQQAKLYADGLQQQSGQRPLIYYTNGYETWLWDDLDAGPRQVHGFLKKDELALAIQRRQSRKPLANASINSAIVARYYQERAIRRIADTFETDRLRKALIVMATGAGKTRTVIALVDLLIRCNWVKNVLFLADRVALVKQAVNAFKTFLPDVPPINLAEEKNGEGRVYVSTYQTMMGLIDEKMESGQKRFGVGHFDLIVIDEAHRSIYHKYGAIFSHFDARLVGLTATPMQEIDRNTYRLFGLENGVPTDAYELQTAIEDKHLVPMQAISVPLKFEREGIHYAQLSQEEQEQWDEIEWNEDGSTPVAVEAAAINQWLFNQDTVDKVLEHLMAHGIKVAGEERLGKTIIFAKNNDHAKFITERFNDNYPDYKGEFARMITYEVNYAQSLIEAFSKKDGMPHIAVSVDMLDTGIDVPEVVNLVFFKTVRSKTKFWQMIGRGTRLCPNLFGPGKDKTGFRIFDYCLNFEYFGQDPNTVDVSPPESLSSRLFKARVAIIAGLDQKSAREPHAAQGSSTYYDVQSEPALRNELAAHLRDAVAALNLDNFIVRRERKMVEKYTPQDAWNQIGPDEQQELGAHLAALPGRSSDEAEEAKRFDLLILRTQLAVLQAQPGFASLRERIQTIAKALSLQTTIPAINSQITLIQALLGDDWWQDVTLPMLEGVRKHLRGLVHLIEKGKKTIIYSDFEDAIGQSSEVDLLGFNSGMDLANFTLKARQFLRAHENHLALQRLRRNQALTPTDVQELAKMLEDAGGSPALIEQARAQSQGLGLFIVSLVGLERAAAKAVMSQFVSGSTVTAKQIEFIDLIVDYLTENGVMAASRLYTSPFTDISPQGPETVFADAVLDQLVAVLGEIRMRAAA